ncbi:hypothetical protein [Micromonospora sp. WMMD1219]|uniref:hypothetical protein n=1 Tax=Micromonospora sp. WMMD1219 TaxID=3404115 RepID=UPI003BF50714
MTSASVDAAGPAGSERVSHGWGAFNVLLSLAVLILIYDQMSLPFGFEWLEDAKPWLRQALVPIGAMLLASLGRRGIKHARALGRRFRDSFFARIKVELDIKAKTKSGDC